MSAYMRQWLKDVFIHSSIVIIVVVSGFIGYLTYKLGILDEQTSLAFFALLALVGIAGYFIFIHKYRKRTREMGVMFLRELKDIISGDDIENRRFNDSFSLRGRYKDRPVSSTFQNTISIETVETAHIWITLTIEKITPARSIIAKLFGAKLKRINKNIILSHNVLAYGPIALKTFSNKENKRQELINILDELVRAAEQIESGYKSK